MHLFTRSPRDAYCCIFSITAILLVCSSGLTQGIKSERAFPTQDNPRIAVSDASIVKIVGWNKREVSITAEVLSAAVQPEEVTIKEEKNKLNIVCHPASPDRKISLIIRAPTKAVIETKADGNVVEVKEPAAEINIVYASKELLQISVPESTDLDMRQAPIGSVRRQFGSGAISTMGFGRARFSGGPPYLKATAPRAHIAITIGSIAPPKRPITFAAQTIARRGGIMGEALHKSNPQLIRTRREPNAPVASADNDDEALKLKTHLVNLNVSATDKAGKAVPGLKPENFSVFEDGVPQQVSFFSPEQSPFNLVLLLDLSGSMRDEIELIKETALHFLNVIGSQDSVAVVTFTTDVTVISQLTKDRDDLRESIDYMLAPAGGTSFYDALGFSLVEVLRKVKGQRNAVIAITDGEDNALQAQLMGGPRPIIAGPGMGSFVTFEELHDGAAEADALIYPIHLNPAPPQVINPRNPPNPKSIQVQSTLTEIATTQLHALADATGGSFYHANRIEDLKGVFEQVAAELRSVYSLAYSPKNLNFDGQFRRIRVQSNKPDVVIRTRPGYFGR
jgi:VWFA-related protein